MPYTHYTTDERNALQAMEGMALPKSYILVILGKHQSSIYRELNRNGTYGVYTGNEAQALSVQRRLETKPSPKLDDPALTREIMGLFKQDLSPDQIAGRLRTLYPDQQEKQASSSTIYRHIYQETAKTPALKVHFRQKQAKPRRRKGAKDCRGQIIRREPGRYQPLFKIHCLPRCYRTPQRGSHCLLPRLGKSLGRWPGRYRRCRGSWAGQCFG